MVALGLGNREIKVIWKHPFRISSIQV